MNKIGKRILTVALFVAVLCTGTTIARAELVERTIGDYYLMAETYITGNYAMARTFCEGRDVYTGVSATYYYIDGDTHSMVSMSDSHISYYNSIIYFYAPGENCRSYDITGYHAASYENENWTNSTYERYIN